MSRTDKTNPYWVKIARGETPHGRIKEYHTHFGPYFQEHGCVLQNPVPRVRSGRGTLRSYENCERWHFYSDGDKIHGRHPRGKSRKLDGKDGRARATLRRLKHKWMSAADVEDIDSFEAAPYQRWLWAKWYWD